MPPKEPAKKSAPQIARQIICDSSLLYLPDNVVEGFQERLETGIDWTHQALARRYHREKCLREDIPTVSFREGLQNRINKSILAGFLDENSPITLQDQWDILLPLSQWDLNLSNNEERKVCFNSVNCITENVEKLIKRAVDIGDRSVLKKEFKEVPMLRVFDSKITELDSSLSEFSKLVTLNLCGNYIGDIDASFLPPGLKLLELQANRIRQTDMFAEHLPPTLLYLGLARNLLTNESLQGLPRLPRAITTLDLSENDIYSLEMVLEGLGTLPCLKALSLAGNPCSVCMGYRSITTMKLPNLQWLDSREILPTDRPEGEDTFEPHPDDSRSNYFNFTILRIMSIPHPPKPEKGATTTFHVELELPLLDSKRRNFLMYRRNESLTEMLPPPEDEVTDLWGSKLLSVIAGPSTTGAEFEATSNESDIYAHLVPKESREILNYTVFESNRVQWNKLVNFQEPTIRIFCPDLVALRDTFQTVVTLRLVYTVTIGKQGKSRKSTMTLKQPPGEYRVVLATIRCALQQPDWSQPFQHFHWDDSLDTMDAIHWGDGDLSVLQYSLTSPKSAKRKNRGRDDQTTISGESDMSFQLRNRLHSPIKNKEIEFIYTNKVVQSVFPL